MTAAWKPSQVIGTLLPDTLILHSGEYDAEFSLRWEVTAVCTTIVSFMIMLSFNNIFFSSFVNRYENIVPGETDLVVEYREKLFCFESEEKLQRFMR